MIDKILIPMDGSDYSKRALSYVNEFAARFKAEVIIIHVYDMPNEIVGFQTTNRDAENSFMMYGDQILKEAHDKLKFNSLNSRTLLVKGEVGRAIIEIAEDEKCNLIIMGSRGLNLTKSLFLGSVSDYVNKHAKCPVMLIK